MEVVTVIRHGAILLTQQLVFEDAMLQPTYKNLQRYDPNDPVGVIYASGSPGPQGNPRLWKYYWQVFSAESPWEDGEFFQSAPLLCNADFEKEVGRLVALGHNCMVYGIRRPRADPANPWEIYSPKWEGVKFAMSYDKDTDPVVMDCYK
jgi:hypothetical protein